MGLNNKGNWTLISMLVAIAIIATVAAIYFTGGGETTTVKSSSPLLDKTSKKKTIVGRSMDTGKSVDCMQRLNQIRTGIATYKASNGAEENPKTFKDIGLGVSRDYYQCPVSGQAYTYDPIAGAVHCPTHTQY